MALVIFFRFALSVPLLLWRPKCCGSAIGRLEVACNTNETSLSFEDAEQIEEGGEKNKCTGS